MIYVFRQSFGDNFFNSHRHDAELLEYRRKQFVEFNPIVLSYINAVIEYLSFCRIGQSADQLDKRCFSGTVWSNNCDVFSGIDCLVDIVYSIAFGALVFVTYIFKLD